MFFECKITIDAQQFFTITTCNGRSCNDSNQLKVLSTVSSKLFIRLSVLITFVRSGVVSRIYNVGSDLNKKKSQKSVLNNKGPSMNHCGKP